MNGASHDSSYGRESQASSATHENTLAVKFPMSNAKPDLVFEPDLIKSQLDACQSKGLMRLRNSPSTDWGSNSSED